MKGKNRKKIIIFGIAVIILIVLIVKLINENELYIRDEKIENEKIEHVALVYKYENWAFGHQEYMYIMDDDGSVYYEDFVKNGIDYIYCGEDVLAMALAVYENEEKIQYKFDKFSDSFKERLYTTNYNWAIFAKGSQGCDAGDENYYSLIRIGEEYELVKLERSGDWYARAWNWDYDAICDYMDDVRKKIYDEDMKKNEE